LEAAVYEWRRGLLKSKKKFLGKLGEGGRKICANDAMGDAQEKKEGKKKKGLREKRPESLFWEKSGDSENGRPRVELKGRRGPCGGNQRTSGKGAQKNFGVWKKKRRKMSKVKGLKKKSFHIKREP